MAEGGMNLDQQFINFSKFGDADSDGKTITLTQLDKWLKQAEILGRYKGKIRISNTDTGVCFNKFKSRTIDYNKFLKFLDDLADRKGIPVVDFKDNLMNCGLPGAKQGQNPAEKKE